ncbi:CRISPR-associated protein Cas5 [Holdemania massiliensis]
MSFVLFVKKSVHLPHLSTAAGSLCAAL